MNADTIADRVVSDLEAAQDPDEAGDTVTLMDDESIDQELMEVLSGAKRAGVNSTASNNSVGRVGQSGGTGVSI